MDKLPYMQFYPGDWKKDPGVQSLTLEEKGFWIELLFMMHESGQRGVLTLNGNRFPEESLAIVLGIDQAKVKQMLSKLVANGVASVVAEGKQNEGCLYSRRMIRDNMIRQSRANAGSKGGKAKARKTRAPSRTPTKTSSSSFTEKKESKEKKISRFTPPTHKDVNDLICKYAAKKKLPFLPIGEEFCDFYQCKGWVVGKDIMKDWPCAAMRWFRRDSSKNNGQATETPNQMMNPL